MSQIPKFSEGEAHAYWQAYVAQEYRLNKFYERVLKEHPDADMTELNDTAQILFEDQSPHEVATKAVTAYNEERSRQAAKENARLEEAENKAKYREAYLAKLYQMW